MKILGISGSTRTEKRSGTIKLLKHVLEHTGMDYELISLHGKRINGCIGCMACADDNICKVKDNFAPLRDKVVEADAYVLGGVNYFSTLNAVMHAFLERWYQFRHREADIMWGKLAVTVGLGGAMPKPPAEMMNSFCTYNLMKVVDTVHATGAFGCCYCSYGETCKVGGHYAIHGPGVPITADAIPDVMKDQCALEAGAKAGKALGDVLRNGYDRMKVTREMQDEMSKLAESIRNA
jgi:multimeric flavodoxin WrbA